MLSKFLPVLISVAIFVPAATASGQSVDPLDIVRFAIDSLNDDRTAFIFQTTPRGTKLDGQGAEAGRFNLSWDTIWYSRGQIDEHGYTLEITIPFFSLRFKPGAEVEMGLNLERIIRRKNEKVNWPRFSRDHQFMSVSRYARMAGLAGVERSVDLEVKPYGIGGATEVPGERTAEAEAGLDLKWGVTPNITADVTVNPDFAQVESDDLQVNLTRFGLFFPEKRDFFIESSSLFQFGIPGSAEPSSAGVSGYAGARKSRSLPGCAPTASLVTRTSA